MKTSFLKNIFSLILTMTVLPMVGQDFMNVYFKDGTTKTFHLDGVKSLEITRIDSEGYAHPEYNYQHITTVNEDYVYCIDEVDSILFTKYNRIQTEQNISSTLTDLFPVLGGCGSIDEVQNKIEKIKGIGAIDKVWIDGESLFIKIKEWTTMSFDFSYNNENSISTEGIKDIAINTIAKARKINNPIGEKLKAVIANQQHYDMSAWRQINISNYLYPLKKEFENAGYETDYLETPNLDFFYSDMYNYDVVFLITHGGYWSTDKQHILLSGDNLGEILVTTDNVDGISEEQEKVFYNKFETIFKNPNYMYCRDDITLRWRKETRNYNGIINVYWVAYPVIYESFFKYRAIGKFSNLNSIFVNIACQSLKHDNNLADIFFDYRNLGTYLGYNESNTFGQRAGSHFLSSMLKGNSAKKAYNELGGIVADYNSNTTKVTGDYLKEDVEEYTDEGKLKKKYSAELLMLKNEKKETDNLFITPIFTNQRNHNEVMDDYYLNKNVMIRAMTTTLDPIVLSMGFEYGTDKNHLNQKILSGTQFNTIDNGEGSYCFASLLEDIELDKTYYYRGYVYDGEYYNYGNICSFKIDKLPDLKISTTSLILALGHTGIIKISGSGDFDAISSDPKTVTVSINNLKDGNADLHIQTHKTGPATITVTDKKTGQTKEIEVTVYPKLQVPTQKLELEEGEKVSFTIAAGSGEYTAKSDKENYATASTKGNEVFIEAVSEGDAVVTITDTKTKLTADVAVKVIKKAAIANITLSTQKLKLNIGETGQIEITSGSGEYGVTNLNSDKAKATLKGTTITIQALAVGDAKIVVTDMKTGQKIIIEVTVTQETAYPDIALSSQEVYLNVGDTEQIEVTSGSGSYSVWVYAPEVANVTISGKIITIKALSLGSTIVKVTDEVTKKTTTFGIAVIPPSAYDKYAVDLGLSVKWSQINVGAVSVEDWGEHYAWGETESKSYFSWSSYDLCNGTESTITKYNSHDGKTILEPSDDAATVVMGRNWRTPTLTEMQELVNRCKWTQETLNGVKGMRVTGPNGNSIFLPFGGQMSEDVLHHSDTTGYYYVSNLSSDGEKYAPALVCYGNKQEFVPHARFFGLSIRPVFNKK